MIAPVLFDPVDDRVLKLVDLATCCRSSSSRPIRRREGHSGFEMMVGIGVAVDESPGPALNLTGGAAHLRKCDPGFPSRGKQKTTYFQGFRWFSSLAISPRRGYIPSIARTRRPTRKDPPRPAEGSADPRPTDRPRPHLRPINPSFPPTPKDGGWTRHARRIRASPTRIQTAPPEHPPGFGGAFLVLRRARAAQFVLMRSVRGARHPSGPLLAVAEFAELRRPRRG